MHVLLARDAPVAVILRRGPSKWFHISLWDTGRDAFQCGQWFHGRIYPERCDLSPDGKLFIYFAGKFRARDDAAGYGYTWIAVSRPPYLTALALWPVGDTWGGDCVFLNNHSVLISTLRPHHPDHPPGPLSVTKFHTLTQNDPRHNAIPSCPSSSPGNRITSGECTLENNSADPYPSSARRSFTLYRPGQYRKDQPVSKFEAHWAGFDQQGRLVATTGGRVLAGELTRAGKLRWRQLAALQDQKPTPLTTPEWARHW